MARDRGPRRRRRWTVPVVVAVVVLALLSLVWFGQRSLVYLPDRREPPPAAEMLPGGEDVVVTTSDGMELGGWYVPPTGRCTSAVLVASGNGGNRAGRVALVEAVSEPGFGVLLVDYRGYAGNDGSPSAPGLALDVRAARDFLLDEGVDAEELVYLGESLGTGVVTELAAEHPPAALVLRSPFTSFADVVQGLYGVPLGPLMRDRYPLLDHLESVRAPVAVVYGSADSLVPATQSREVARAARAAGSSVVEVEVAGAGHNDGGLAHGQDLVDAVVEVAELAGITGCR